MCTLTNWNMFIRYIVSCCLTYLCVSEGRTVQGIKGRNVSLSWTFTDMKKDPILILHGSTTLVRVWLAKTYFVQHTNDERLQFIGEKSNFNTVKVTINIINATETDAGNYTVEQQLDPEEINDSVCLEILDEKFIPRITLIRHSISNSTIVLLCNSSSLLVGRIQWKMNGSMIGVHGRYSQNKTFLSIVNLTDIDSYNLYTCSEIGNRFESDPYRLIYGPDEIFFNTSDNAIQVDAFDTISIICSADCFPPCKIVWNDANSEGMIQGSELKPVNLIKDVNYTCHATNPRKSNVTISSTIYIKVRSGGNYITMAATPGTDSPKFHSTHHFLYVVLGLGGILAFGIFSCVLHKFRVWLRTDSSSKGNSLRHTNKDCGDKNLEEETTFGNYWTIVSNARGEMRTTIEANVEQQKPIKLCQRKLPKQNKSEQSISVNDFNVAVGFEEYMDPIHSRSIEGVDYIHPIHSDPLKTDFVQKHHTV